MYINNTFLPQSYKKFYKIRYYEEEHVLVVITMLYLTVFISIMTFERL